MTAPEAKLYETAVLPVLCNAKEAHQLILVESQTLRLDISYAGAQDPQSLGQRCSVTIQTSGHGGCDTIRCDGVD